MLWLLLLDVSVSRVSITRRVRNQLRRFDFHFVLLRFIKSIFYLFSFFFLYLFQANNKTEERRRERRERHARSVGWWEEQTKPWDPPLPRLVIMMIIMEIVMMMMQMIWIIGIGIGLDNRCRMIGLNDGRMHHCLHHGGQHHRLDDVMRHRVHHRGALMRHSRR